MGYGKYGQVAVAGNIHNQGGEIPLIADLPTALTVSIVVGIRKWDLLLYPGVHQHRIGRCPDMR